VSTLLDGMAMSGHHRVQFDGALLSSGVYIYRLESSNYSTQRKMILLR